MGRCSCLEKCRGRGEETGAGDGDAGEGRVSIHAAKSGESGHVDKSCACVLAHVLYAGGMKQSIRLKSLVILGGVMAISGVAFVGFRHVSEVRGDTKVHELGGAAHHAPQTTPTPDASDGQADMLSLQPEDFATYTHPRYGFSFRYPKDFIVSNALSSEEDVIDLYHPTLPLGIRVSVRPLEMQGALVGELDALPDSYTQEAPKGADSTAVGWIDQDVPYEGDYQAEYWFAKDGRLYEIQLHAQDLEWLEAWLHEFVHDDLTLE
jgi:hypothetical protein